jgi:Ca2+/H+ antiporter, TMEM165/GDT1 family
MVDWIHIGPHITAAFLASLVEFIEALTIVLAVGTVRGWRPALIGTGGGLITLGALVTFLGRALSAIPITVLQLVIGLLLLLFGLSWLRKAVLRAAGMIPLHDEARAYKGTTNALHAIEPAAVIWWDTIAIATTFKAVVLEGIEVVFIVIAVGSAGQMLWPASLGAAAAGIVVLILGLAVRRPLARVPENKLKFTVAILISSFGVFWMGEGLGFHWPGQDLSILGLVVALLLLSLTVVSALRKSRRASHFMERKQSNESRIYRTGKHGIGNRPQPD